MSIQTIAISQEEKLVLPEMEKVKLEAKLAKIASPYDHSEDAILQSLIACYQEMPEGLLGQIRQFSNDPEAPGFLVLNNLPTGHVPDTPVHGGQEENREDFVLEAMTLGLGALIGEPIGYRWEKDNQLVHHVIPLPGGEYSQSNQGSKVFLKYHNDMVFSEELVYNQYNPDFLILFCVRADADHQAETRYVEARELIKHFSDEELERLRMPIFQMASPSNYSRLMSEDGVKWSHYQPVLSGSLDYPEVALGANGVRTEREEDQALINKIYSISNGLDVYKSVKLVPGQAMLINNRKGIHARTQFTPSGDANERWLVRGNIRQNLWSMRQFIDGGYRRYR